MPAKRHSIHAEFQPIAIEDAERIQRLARASALLARGEARRLQAQAMPVAQSEVAIGEEFIHNPFPITETIIP